VLVNIAALVSKSVESSDINGLSVSCAAFSGLFWLKLPEHEARKNKAIIIEIPDRTINIV